MSKKEFHSSLFKRIIKPSDKAYSYFVKAEIIYRLFELHQKNCSCTLCSQEINKLKSYYEKIKDKD